MLLAELITEEFTKLKSGRNIPELWAGDSVQISKLPFIYSKEVDVINGVVIGVTNRSSDTAIKLLNVRLLFLSFIAIFSVLRTGGIWLSCL